MTLDAIGSALEPYPRKDRARWFRGEKVVMKRNARRIGSFNTQFMLVLMQSMSYTFPLESCDLPEYRDDLEDILSFYYKQVFQTRTRNRYILHTQGQRDNGISFSTGMAIAYYLGLIDNNEPGFIFDFSNAVASVLNLNESEAIETFFLVNLFLKLFNNGYFSKDDLDWAFNFSNETPHTLSFRAHMDALAKIALNEDALRHDLLGAHFEGMHYGEQVIYETLYYLTRISTLSGPDMLPRNQLQVLFTKTVCPLTDVAFLFGGLCCASEHRFALLPKAHTETVEGKELVDEILQTLCP